MVFKIVGEFIERQEGFRGLLNGEKLQFPERRFFLSHIFPIKK
jgi:hypothetical protein